MTNKIKESLLKLDIIKEDTIVADFKRCRDRDDVSVLRCLNSNVIFLSRTDHMNISYYEQKKDFEYWGVGDRKKALLISLEDNESRLKQFKNIISNKVYVDVGTGTGGVLDVFKNYASQIAGVEPQIEVRENLKKIGYNMYSDISELPNNTFDIMSLFHVFEHLTDPIGFLDTAFSKLKVGGRIIIEVPHANDLLITTLINEAFKRFTFWSEHLILHTRQSLQKFLKHAGFDEIFIQGVQRHPVANHLHWLTNGKSGGHHKWGFLRSDTLDQSYSSILASLDATDTLMLQATKS
jgi:SAM-dependent methyltransferase